MLTKTKLKIAGAAIVVIGAFTSGWTVKGWQVGAEELAAERAAQKVIDRERNREADIAAQVTQILSENTLNERVIERQLQPIVERPIYQVDCVDPDGLRVINGLQ